MIENKIKEFSKRLTEIMKRLNYDVEINTIKLVDNEFTIEAPFDPFYDDGSATISITLNDEDYDMGIAFPQAIIRDNYFAEVVGFWNDIQTALNNIYNK